MSELTPQKDETPTEIKSKGKLKSSPEEWWNAMMISLKMKLQR